MDNRVLNNIKDALRYRKDKSLNTFNSANLKKLAIVIEIKNIINHIKDFENDTQISINHLWHNEHKTLSYNLLNTHLHSYANINNLIQRLKTDILRDKQKIEAISMLININLKEQLHQLEIKEEEDVEDLYITKEYSNQ